MPSKPWGLGRSPITAESRGQRKVVMLLPLREIAAVFDSRV